MNRPTMRKAAVIIAGAAVFAGALVAYATGPGSSWSQATAAAPWGVRIGHSSVYMNNQLWLMGGLGAGNSFHNDVWSSPDGSTWTQVTAAAPWSGRFTAGSVVFKNAMWVIGGADNTFATKNDVWSSPDGATWTQATAAAPWTSRQGMGVAVSQGAPTDTLWISGGGTQGSSFSLLNDVWYSADGTNWTQATANAPWSVRRYHGFVSFNGKLWVLGGLSNRNDALNDVWSSPDGTNWTQVTANAPWQARGGASVLVAAGRIWIIGGEYLTNNDPSTEVHFNDVWSSADGVNWVQAVSPAPWSAREFHTAVYGANKLWLMGGGQNIATDADVWYSNIGNKTTATAVQLNPLRLLSK